MKNKLLSFTAVLTCLCFCVSPLCANAVLPEWAIIIAQTVFSDVIQDSISVDNTTGDRGGIAGIARNVQDHLARGSFINPLRVNEGEDISFQYPNYDIVTGKYQMQWDIGEYNSNAELTNKTTDDILIECSFILTDKPSYLDSLGYPVKSDGTGMRIYPNSLNITITRTSGSVTRFVLVYTNFDYSRRVTVTSNYISISEGSGTLYRYSGSGLTDIVAADFYCDEVRFTTLTTNQITEYANGYINTGSSRVTPYPTGIYSFRGGSVSQSSALPYPLDVDICHGSINFKYPQIKTDGTLATVANGYRFKCLLYLKTSFITSNNPNHTGIIQNNYTQPSQQNFYIDNRFIGGTTINRNNYNDFGGGAWGLPFNLPDIDLPSLPMADILDLLGGLLPDFDTTIQPTLQANIDDLFGKLFDFYANMPDIGLPWSGDGDDNDYWEVELPSLPDDGGGGGSGGDVNVTVDVNITRPQIPAIDTSPHVTLYYPTVTTTSLPANVIEAGAEFVDWGKEVTDLTGTTNIIIVCGLIGVGVMLIFKDW